MIAFPADLHIHTSLSPCGADEMTPPAIVRAAQGAGLSIIAICDHNTVGNVAAVQAAAQLDYEARKAGGDQSPSDPALAGHHQDAAKLMVLPGIEITTQEEAHILGLFPDLNAAAATAAQVQATLPDADEPYYIRFGSQYLTQPTGEVVGCERKMLAVASGLDLNTAVKLIHRHHGIAVAAHVDRHSFSVIRQLGVFPIESGFDVIEVFTPSGPKAAATRKKHAASRSWESYGLPIISSSDSHYLADIGRTRTICELEQATFEELVWAFQGKSGRKVQCQTPC